MVALHAGAVCARLASLATAGLGMDAFTHAAYDLLRHAVPFDYACLAVTDPATGLITGAVKSNDDDWCDEQFARYEYEVADVNQFADLARRANPVGILEQETGGRPERSPRFHDFLSPLFSARHELRMVVRSAGAVWGLLALYRTSGCHGFTPADADFAAAVRDHLARGLRAGLIVQAVTAPVADSGPAVIVVGARNRVQLASPAVWARVAELGGADDGRLPLPLLSTIAAARGMGSAAAPTVPRVRARTADGRWLVVHAAPLAGPDGTAGQVVLTIEDARPPEVLPLVVAALGLTRRERDVIELVFRGAGTAEIARTLHLSPYTVQDHLKAVFAKAGVNSRRELNARVFFQLYAPRIGTPLGTGAWFTD